MRLAGAILGALGGVSTILFIVEVLRSGEEYLISDKLGAMFWLYLGGLLFLGAITCFMGSRNNSVD